MPDPRYEVVAAEHRHAAILAATLRAADAAEVAASGVTPQRAVWRSYRRSTYAKTVLVDGEVAAMWGLCGNPFSRIGYPWLLTSPAAERAQTAFLRVGRAEVAFMLSLCPELRGYVDASYAKALRLLEAFGFDLSEEFPFGPNRLPFRQYRMTR